MRFLIAAILAALALVLGVWGILVISMIFAEYKDSVNSTYLTIGGVGIVGSLLLISAAALCVYRPGRSRLWLMLSMASLIASMVPYIPLIGGLGYLLHGVFVLLALGAIYVYVSRHRTAI
jgi:hypothetical protein